MAAHPLINSILPSSLLADLNGPFSLAGFQQIQADFRQWLSDHFETWPVPMLVKARARFVDLMLNRLWQHFDLDKEPVALIAVGGYGRGELHLFSDIDLLVLSRKGLKKPEQEKISQLITLLWDLKFEVGQSVRTLKETVSLAKDDVTIATNLLEKRFLAGDEEIFEELKQTLEDKFPWSERDFYLAKREEQESRHRQHKGSAYNLEPNVKANPGGLRDIQTIGWVAKRHFHTNTFQQLVDRGYLTQEEREELIECRDLLWHVRLALHMEAGRAENRLLFDYQPGVAKRLGFGSDPKRAVASMMKRLFRTIQRVIVLNQMLLQHFDSEILGNKPDGKGQQLDDDFYINGNLISATDNHTFFQRKNFLKLFLHVADHPEITEIESSTVRHLRQVRRRLMGDLQDYDVCQKLFVQILKHPNSMANAIPLMHKHGVLSAYLPQWRNIVGQMQFDLFHAYTVDEHTNRLLKNLHQYYAGETDPTFHLCFDIAQSFDKPELLYIAGLFHDIAKGRGGDHSTLGAQDVTAFMQMHGFEESDTSLVAWLVKSHLLMSTTAQRKDIHDPDVINQFAQKVKNKRCLDYLYCLTVADIRATNDNLWNAWKASLLSDLYLFTRHALANDFDAQDEFNAIGDTKQHALQLLQQSDIDIDTVNALWKQFKDEYFAFYRPDQIAWQCKHILDHGSKGPLVLVSTDNDSGGTQLFVYVKDQNNAFANMVQVIEQKKLSIQHAQISSSRDGYILDTFDVLGQDGNTELNQSTIDSVKRGLIKALSDDRAIKRVRRRASRKIKQFNVQPKVEFQVDKRKNRTRVDITALDIPGLLSVITDVFQKTRCHIHSAKITTIGERAEDLFTLTNPSGQALTEQEETELKGLLLQRLASETDTV